MIATQRTQIKALFGHLSRIILWKQSYSFCLSLSLRSCNFPEYHEVNIDGHTISAQLFYFSLNKFELFHSLPIAKSPLAYTGVHQRFFRFVNIFEHQSKSPYWSKYHGPLLYVIRAIFLHFASVLQFISLFTCKSIIEVSNVLFVAPSWANITTKSLLFMVKKREILDLWQQLNDDDFKVKTSDDLQWVSIFSSYTNYNFIFINEFQINL